MEKIKSYQEDSEVQKNRWWILVSVAMFTFMSTLDSSIVNIALPTISKEMSVPMNQAEWVVSIYLMVVCACLLLFGKIGDSFGKIKVYRIGTVIFTIGSLLCGFNQSLSFLLFARVVQSIGASMTMATNSGMRAGAWCSRCLCLFRRDCWSWDWWIDLIKLFLVVYFLD